MPDLKAVSFRDLTLLLKRHGFSLTRIKGSHHLFTHASTGTTIMLPDDSSTKPAMPVQIAGVRRILDERGLLSREEFDVEVNENGHPNGKQRDSGPKRAGAR